MLNLKWKTNIYRFRIIYVNNWILFVDIEWSLKLKLAFKFNTDIVNISFRFMEIPFKLVKKLKSKKVMWRNLICTEQIL